MGGVLLALYFLLLKWFVINIKAEEANITFPFILNATDMKNFSKTAILRYGFHKTHKCLDFQKTYVCTHSCLTKGYDIASADKDCKCTCFKDKLKSKYFGVKSVLKIPTTTIPSWVGGYLDPSKEKYVVVHTQNKDIIQKPLHEDIESAESGSEDEYETSEDEYYSDTNSDESKENNYNSEDSEDEIETTTTEEAINSTVTTEGDTDGTTPTTEDTTPTETTTEAVSENTTEVKTTIAIEGRKWLELLREKNGTAVPLFARLGGGTAVPPDRRNINN